jgi:hypothetical protein
VFNEDSLYRAHNKRTKRMEKELQERPQLIEDLTEEQLVERMATEVEA